MKPITTAWLWSYLGRNWFKLLLFGVLFFLVSQKELTFDIHLGRSKAPPPPPAEQPAQPAAAKPKRELLLTENVAQPSVFERLNIFSGPAEIRTPQFQHLLGMDETRVRGFIRRFASVAQTEQEKYGIPASIILANGLVHSLAGDYPATTQGYNYFRLPCSADWHGPTVEAEGNCLRRYENAWTSFRDHSLFLTTGELAHLPRLGKTDYAAWAAALEKARYAGTENLAKELERTIDRWDLFQYD